MGLLGMSVNLLRDRACSMVRVGLLRLRGAKIGRRVQIGRVQIGMDPASLCIGDGVVIRSGLRIGNVEHLLIGDYVKVHANVSIEAGSYGTGVLEIGHNSWIGEETILNCYDHVVIGRDVGIGARSQVWTHGIFPSRADGFPSKIAPVQIRDGAWLPPMCVVLPGVTIGKHSIIGTGSVVVKDIPEHVFATGIPCCVQQEDERKYRSTLSPGEKLHMVVSCCVDHLRKLGFRVEGRVVNGEEAWHCSWLCLQFWISGNTTHVDALKTSRACIFLSETEDVPEADLGGDNVTLFDVGKNTYRKKGTLHEWIVIRALLDTCTLRVTPNA
jgi:acetyltransferase-like isoleucine patch superfamily enzyme